VSHASLIAAAAAEMAGLRAASDAHDPDAFRARFWGALRVLDRAGRAMGRDMNELLAPRNGCSAGAADAILHRAGSVASATGTGASSPMKAKKKGRGHVRGGARIVAPVVDLMNREDEPPMEWEWSPHSSIDLGPSTEARENVIAMVQIPKGARRVAADHVKAEPARRERRASEGSVELLWYDSPEDMLKAIEATLMAAGLHRARPNPKHVNRSLTGRPTYSRG
jgi:hypothetical protein